MSDSSARGSDTGATHPDDAGQIEFSAEGRTRIATFSGIVTDALMLGAYEGLVSRPDYDAEADDLVDLRAVTRLAVTADGLRRLMGMFGSIDRLGVPTRLALVAPKDDVYGVSRMYQMMRGDDVPEEIGVFRDLDAAHAFIAAGAGRGESAA